MLFKRVYGEMEIEAVKSRGWRGCLCNRNDGDGDPGAALTLLLSRCCSAGIASGHLKPMPHSLLSPSLQRHQRHRSSSGTKSYPLFVTFQFYSNWHTISLSFSRKLSLECAARAFHERIRCWNPRVVNVDVGEI